MNLRAYLIVSSSGNLRLLKRPTGLRADEISVELNLSVPDSFFVKPQPKVNLTVEEENRTLKDPAVERTARAPELDAGFNVVTGDVRSGAGENLLAILQEIRDAVTRTPDPYPDAVRVPGWLEPEEEPEEEPE